MVGETYPHVVRARNGVNPKLYWGDRYGEFSWRKDGDHAVWRFQTKAGCDLFIKNHKHLEATWVGSRL